MTGPDRRGFVPVPNAAVRLARSNEEMARVLDLWEMADRHDYAELDLSGRFLSERWECGKSTVERFLNRLIRAGLTEVSFPGNRLEPRRMRFWNPAEGRGTNAGTNAGTTRTTDKPADSRENGTGAGHPSGHPSGHVADQSNQTPSSDSRPQTPEPLSTLATPKTDEAVQAVKAILDEVRSTHHPRLTGKGYRRWSWRGKLNSLTREQQVKAWMVEMRRDPDAPEGGWTPRHVRQLAEWMYTSDNPCASGARSTGEPLATMLRPMNRLKYLGLAEQGDTQRTNGATMPPAPTEDYQRRQRLKDEAQAELDRERAATQERIRQRAAADPDYAKMMGLSNSAEGPPVETPNHNGVT